MSVRDLSRFALFEELSPEEREAVAAELAQADVAKGRAVFAEGEEADGLVLLVAGELRLENAAAGPLGTMRAGASLGALSLFSAGRREATARAVSRCRVMWLDRSGFRRLVEDAPRAACKLEEAILRDLALLLRQGLPHLMDSSG